MRRSTSLQRHVPASRSCHRRARFPFQPRRLTISPSLNPTRQGGFTLLELLVVLFIVGIVISMGALSVGTSGPERLLHQEVRRLQALITLAGEEAMFNFGEYGLELTRTGYGFRLFDASGHWGAVSDGSLMKDRTLVADARFYLTVEGEKVTLEKKKQGTPQLFFYSSGEWTPFELEIRREGEVLYTLKGNAAGGLKREGEAQE
ncbi:MAG: type II secretion system minor pseudopilin GspH [Magnetococcales bacterium]|nr:type II secretion system minor pseudopilin GspH [Magnetococcales bacterium]